MEAASSTECRVRAGGRGGNGWSWIAGAQLQRAEELCHNGELQVVKKAPAKNLLSSHLFHQ